MQPTLPLLCLLASLTLVASCSAPPRPPSVDPSSRRPANTSLGIELQQCSNELKNAQLLVSEKEQLAQRMTAALANATAQHQMLTAMAAAGGVSAAGSSVYTVSFDFGSTVFWLPPSDAQRLVNEARSAPLVALRGRTDGAADTLAEGRIASGRANAVREFLVAGGVDPARIRTTYQPAGDHLVDNSGPTGRALNRRVEIEIYRVAPTTTHLPRPNR